MSTRGKERPDSAVNLPCPSEHQRNLQSSNVHKVALAPEAYFVVGLNPIDVDELVKLGAGPDISLP